jgi:pimeloyl-ACP methyl ester carboxylesterase
LETPQKNYQRVVLHPDDMRFEAQEPARIRPDQIHKIAYHELVEELRYNLRTREDKPVPVYPFAYDWRMPLTQIETQFTAFVDEVIQRTKLLKHYHKAGYANDARVNIVAHSMGGLITAGYLAGMGRKAPVNKIVTLATPFRGSFEAIIKMTTGTANLGTDAPSSRERETARLMPALYHLIPDIPDGIITSSSKTPKSLFDPNAWQSTIIDSIAEFIRLKGLSTKNRKEQAATLFSNLLNHAKAYRDRIDTFRLSDAGLKEKDWLAVVGVDAETRVCIRILRRGGTPVFDLRKTDRTNKWEETDSAARRLTGDGTVPYEGSVPNFLKESNLVCVTPDDFGYWEIMDRILLKASGFHGILPKMNMLHRLIVRFFTGRPDSRRNTWGRPAPGITKWQQPLPLWEMKDE